MRLSTDWIGPFIPFMMAVLLLCTPRMALSLPSVQTLSDSDDDATVTLSLLIQAIPADAVSWCEFRIEVVDAAVPLTSGDSVSMWVYEDDFAGDDLVWTSSFTVTAAEVSGGLVDRTFDCSGMIEQDGAGSPEVYAEARVDKSACGFGCVIDAPMTPNADVTQITDDDAEHDDTSGEAVGIFPGITPGRVEGWRGGP